MTAPGDPRQAFLPGRPMTKLERARMPRVLPPPSSSASWVPPLSVTELEALGLVADGWEHFDVKERSIAAWLRENDVDVVSVQPSQVNAQRTPDAVLAAGPVSVSVEFKTPESSGGIYAGVRAGRSQSRRLVIDLRGLDAPDWMSALSRALSRGGGDLDEVLMILPDGEGVAWRRSEHP